MSRRRKLAVAGVAVLGLALAGGAGGKRSRDDFTRISNQGPSWSPDGKRLAYASYEAHFPQIHLVDAAGRHTVRLTFGGRPAFLPRWLPSGNGIAYTTQELDGTNAVHVVDVRTGETRTLLRGLNGTPDWSPDGTKIVYDVPVRTDPLGSQVWVANADGTAARMIVSDASLWGAQPDWSPDGSRIAYVSGANHSEHWINVVRADGGGDVRLTREGNEWEPDWSPDGSKILFAEGPFGRGKYSLAVVDVDGRDARALTSGNWNDMTPSWSPDGRRIAFTSDRTGNSEIWVIDRGGGKARRLTHGGCTLIGTARAETLVGRAARRDVICGLAGDDVLRGRGGDDKLVGGRGSDRLLGGAGDDTLFGEQGNDVLLGGDGTDRLSAGPGDDAIDSRDHGVDSVDGGAGRDRLVGDRVDSVLDVERANVATHRRYRGPTLAAMVAQTRAAVRAARAQVVVLRIVPRREYTLAVRVRDPAAFLKHRVNTIVRVMNRLTTFPGPFRHVEFSVFDGADRVLNYTHDFYPANGSDRLTFYVEPKLAGCALGIDLPIELYPDGGAPSCPVR